MTYADAKWADAEHRLIDVVWQGQPIQISAIAGLLHYDALVAGGVPIAEVDLAQLRRHYRSAVDEAAERARQRFLTGGVGQAMVYAEKFAQANAVDAMGEATALSLSEESMAAQFPLLAASVGIEAPTLWGVSQLVLGRYAAFLGTAGMIEALRLGAKKAIAEAETIEAVIAAAEGVAWPSPD